MEREGCSPASIVRITVRWSATTWFVILSTTCIAGPYLLGVPPKTPRERLYIALTIAFLAWLLPFMASLQ